MESAGSEQGRPFAILAGMSCNLCSAMNARKMGPRVPISRCNRFQRWRVRMPFGQATGRRSALAGEDQALWTSACFNNECPRRNQPGQSASPNSVIKPQYVAINPLFPTRPSRG